MANTVAMIGIDLEELVWLRTLIFLLRHPDPVNSEMAQQALQYLAENAHKRTESRPTVVDQAG
ncbi:MAG: hypothetical protein WDO73_12805 [Ignavibacteriota bacterium]